MFLGSESVLADRTKMLDKFDAEIKKIHALDSDTIARNIFCEYLSLFLPEKYGVCNGFIIDTNKQKESQPIKWDIIIFNKLESPKITSIDENNEKIQYIPMKYVKCVIEVRSKLNKKSAKSLKNKIIKIKSLLKSKNNNSDTFPDCFFILPVFFKTDTTSQDDYRECLDEINELANSLAYMFKMALIMQSQKNKDASAVLMQVLYNIYMEVEELLEVWDETSDSTPSGRYNLNAHIISTGYAVNKFPCFMIDLIDLLNEEVIAGNKSHNYYGYVDGDSVIDIPCSLWREA